jgi:hypothetical protein
MNLYQTLRRHIPEDGTFLIISFGAVYAAANGVITLAKNKNGKLVVAQLLKIFPTIYENVDAHVHKNCHCSLT